MDSRVRSTHFLLPILVLVLAMIKIVTSIAFPFLASGEIALAIVEINGVVNSAQFVRGLSTQRRTAMLVYHSLMMIATLSQRARHLARSSEIVPETHNLLRRTRHLVHVCVIAEINMLVAIALFVDRMVIQIKIVSREDRQRPVHLQQHLQDNQHQQQHLPRSLKLQLQNQSSHYQL